MHNAIRGLSRRNRRSAAFRNDERQRLRQVWPTGRPGCAAAAFHAPLRAVLRTKPSRSLTLSGRRRDRCADLPAPRGGYGRQARAGPIFYFDAVITDPGVLVRAQSHQSFLDGYFRTTGHPRVC